MINQPFQLPCGVKLNNRIAKAAMTERLAKSDHLPNEAHFRLYDHWASSGSGLLISGNIMVQSKYFESGGNIVLEAHTELDAFHKWTKTVTNKGVQFWAQISHPGRQATIFNTWKPVSASNVKLKKIGLFARPRALRSEEVDRLCEQYIQTASQCKKAGFTGVQVHAAHGYLLSQFLSPKTNQRTDKWGGNIENRARLLILIVRGIRTLVGPQFPISVKLNSADFQRGGFDETDAIAVIKRLESEGIDLLEISGGTYEQIEFLQNAEIRTSTKEREAYFLEFAKQVRKQSNIPIMVTGGFRSLAFCNQALENNALDIIGFARPYILQPDFPAPFLKGVNVSENPLRVKIKQFQDLVEGAWYDYQIWRQAHGENVDLDYSPANAVIRLTVQEMWKGIRG